MADKQAPHNIPLDNNAAALSAPMETSVPDGLPPAPAPRQNIFLSPRKDILPFPPDLQSVHNAVLSSVPICEDAIPYPYPVFFTL